MNVSLTRKHPDLQTRSFGLPLLKLRDIEKKQNTFFVEDGPADFSFTRKDCSSACTPVFHYHFFYSAELSRACKGKDHGEGSRKVSGTRCGKKDTMLFLGQGPFGVTGSRLGWTRNSVQKDH
jgi:hypothetical protein